MAEENLEKVKLVTISPTPSTRFTIALKDGKVLGVDNLRVGMFWVRYKTPESTVSIPKDSINYIVERSGRKGLF